MKVIFVLVFLVISNIGYCQKDSIKGFYFIDSIGIETNGANVFSKNQWNESGLNSIEIYNPKFNYMTLTSWSTSSGYCSIIERSYLEEEYHWTCIFNNFGILIDWRETAYYNSEGFRSVNSIIDGNKIHITEWNLYSNPKQIISNYFFTDNGFAEIN